MEAPCRGCDLEFKDKDNITCEKCQKRVQYVKFIQGPVQDIPGYTILPTPSDDVLTFRPRTNLRPEVECKYPYCSTLTRQANGYCYRCAMRNRLREKRGIPLDLPLIRGFKTKATVQKIIDDEKRKKQ